MTSAATVCRDDARRPCLTDHVGTTQLRQAGEWEYPLAGRTFAFGLSEPLHLLDSQVHARSLFGFKLSTMRRALIELEGLSAASLWAFVFSGIRYN